MSNNLDKRLDEEFDIEKLKDEQTEENGNQWKVWLLCAVGVIVAGAVITLIKSMF